MSTVLEFRVSDILQYASGGSYVVKYDAQVELVRGDSSVVIEVVSTVPLHARVSEVQQAVDYTKRGVETVLRPLGLGAQMRLSRLFIHDVDFKPRKFEAATISALTQALEDAKKKNGIDTC
jgi:hypothetical protein